MSCFALNFEVVNEEDTDQMHTTCENINVCIIFLLIKRDLINYLVYMNWLIN